MFRQWLQSSPSIPELSSTQECDALIGQDLLVLFKHSPTCPISLFAHHEVVRFRTAQPDTPVYLVSVRRQRELARHIAECTGIRHESPQILVLRHGNVIGAASHDAITADWLISLVGSEQVLTAGI